MIFMRLLMATSWKDIIFLKNIEVSVQFLVSKW